ncbi:unnamed protein product [Lampetra planeri]
MDLAEAQEMPPQNHGVPRSSSTPQGLAVGGSSLVGTPFTVSPVSIPPSPPRLTDEPRRAPSAPLGEASCLSKCQRPVIATAK